MIITSFPTNFQCNYRKRQQTLPVPALSGLNRDVVSFSSSPKMENKYERHGGWCEFFYKHEGFEKTAPQKVPVLKNKTFGINEYSLLTEPEKEYLREIISLPYLKHAGLNDVRIRIKDDTRTIKDDAEFFINTALVLKDNLDKKYPDGWTFVAIGGSCSLFAKIFEYLGESSKIVPFSIYISPDTSQASGIDYPKYFDDINLQSGESPKIYADYVASGRTMKMFTKILTESGIRKENDVFINFIDLFEGSLDEDESKLLDDWFLNRNQISSFTPCPEMNKYSDYKYAAEIDENFEWNLPSKLMSFALLDYLINSGIKQPVPL